MTAARCQALEFLKNNGAHTMPKQINTEAEFAAALIFVELMENGLAICMIGDAENGPTYTITQSGLDYLSEHKHYSDNDNGERNENH